MPKIDLTLDEIPFGVPFRLECKGTPLVIIRTNGSIRVFPDRCPHAHWPLSEGDLKDGVLQCVGHGWQFDVNTGHCLTVPQCDLKAFPVVLYPDRVQIEWD
jgi:nitrite reductase/ring-hydroxylating ferredoxin subunit